MEETRTSMRLETVEALLKVGATHPQAMAIAAAIPDIEPLRGEMELWFTKVDAEFGKLKGELRWIKWSVVVMIAFLGVILALAGFLVSAAVR